MKPGCDVLIIGGYEVSEHLNGMGEAAKNWLRFMGKPASLYFLANLVDCDGDLEAAAGRLAAANPMHGLGWPLGAVYLLDFLGKQGLSVEGVGYYAYEQDRFRELAAARPCVVAISTTFITEAAQIGEIARAIKAVSPNTIVVAGGAKILKSHREYRLWREGRFEGCDIAPMAANNPFFPEARLPEVDAFVIADAGETTLLDVFRAVKSGADLSRVSNLAFMGDDGPELTPRVEELNHFARHAISWDRIPDGVAGLEIPVRGGVGCPFRCAFCDFTGLHRNVRSRPLDGILNELRSINDVFPDRRVFFTDDNLFASPKRIHELCGAIIENGLQLSWRAFFRADAIDETGAELLARAGCHTALLGVESGDDSILANMRKRSCRDTILRAIRLLDRYSVDTLSTMIVGFPGETCRSVDATIDLLNAYPHTGRAIHRYLSFVFVSLPLAPASMPEFRHEHRLKGLYLDWTHDTMTRPEAERELRRVFEEVDGPTLQYPDYPSADLPGPVLYDLLRTRDDLVKRGVSEIDTANARMIAETFRPILARVAAA